MKDAQISSEQEDCVLSMVQSESLAVWRDARAKSKGERSGVRNPGIRPHLGVCVTHGAKTKYCGQYGCSMQVVSGGKCKGHGQSKKPETFWGQCSKCPLKSVNGELVCGSYPCMNHSGKGLRCDARGCNKHV
jgi:hypothetical protein